MTPLRIPEHVTWFRRGDTVFVFDLRSRVRQGLTGRLARVFQRAASSEVFPSLSPAEPALLERLVSAGWLCPAET